MQNLSDFTARVDYVMSQIKFNSLPSQRALFDWFYREVQECSAIKRIIDSIRDVESDTEEERRLKNYSHFRKRIAKEMKHLQVQKTTQPRRMAR